MTEEMGAFKLRRKFYTYMIAEFYTLLLKVGTFQNPEDWQIQAVQFRKLKTWPPSLQRSRAYFAVRSMFGFFFS